MRTPTGLDDRARGTPDRYSGPEGEDEALRGSADLDRGPGEGGHDGVDLVVGAGRVVVVQEHPADAGRLPETDGVAAGGVAPAGLLGQLGVGVLGVVDQDVATRGERERGLVVLTQALGPRADD